MPEKKPAKILQCWPAMRKIGVFFKIERCEMPAIRTPAAVLACDASACDAKSLAMWVERCEPLSPRVFAMQHAFWQIMSLSKITKWL